MTRVFLGLGSNRGARRARLEEGLGALEAHPDVGLGAVSSAYETDPVGDPSQPPYLNAAAEAFTDLEPAEFLDVLHGIERAAGRGAVDRAGARTLDLDLLFFGTRVLRGAALTVPHPRYPFRAFVLVPLAEIAPRWADPVTGLTIGEQLARFPDTSGVRPAGPLRVQVP